MRSLRYAALVLASAVAWTVVPGSGTGVFAGFEGSGGYRAEPHSTTWNWRLEG